MSFYNHSTFFYYCLHCSNLFFHLFSFVSMKSYYCRSWISFFSNQISYQKSYLYFNFYQQECWSRYRQLMNFNRAHHFANMQIFYSSSPFIISNQSSMMFQWLLFRLHNFDFDVSDLLFLCTFFTVYPFKSWLWSHHACFWDELDHFILHFIFNFHWFHCFCIINFYSFFFDWLFQSGC